MTDLTPAAASTVQAFDDRYELLGGLEESWQEDCLAAALRAAADQVVPDKCPPIEDFNEFDQGYAVAHLTHRQALLAIAAELEAM